MTNKFLQSVAERGSRKWGKHEYTYNSNNRSIERDDGLIFFLPPEWKYFTDPFLGRVDWNRLPEPVRRWSHASGLFLYRNSIWDGPQFEDVRHDANDHTVYEFMQIAIPAHFGNRILFDPGQTGDIFFVYKSEWDAAITLSDDYTVSRRYK